MDHCPPPRSQPHTGSFTPLFLCLLLLQQCLPAGLENIELLSAHVSVSWGDWTSVCVNSARHSLEVKALANPETTKLLSAAWNQVLQMNMQVPQKSERQTWLCLLGSAGFIHSNLSVEALCPSERSDESTKFQNSNSITSHKWKENEFQNTYLIKDLYSNYTNNYRTNSPIRNGFISEQETYLASEDSKWSEVAQLCPTLYGPMDSSLHQAPPSMGFSRQEVLEWVAISFSRESSQPRDRTQVSHIVDRHFTVCSVSHTFRELQIKTMRKYCTTIKTAELKKKNDTTNWCKREKQQKLSFTAGEMDIQLLCKIFGKIFAKLY